MRNPGPHLQTHYDGLCHRGVAQLTLDDTSRVHVREDDESGVCLTEWPYLSEVHKVLRK
jgi:hypothetical protein